MRIAIVVALALMGCSEADFRSGGHDGRKADGGSRGTNPRGTRAPGTSEGGDSDAGTDHDGGGDGLDGGNGGGNGGGTGDLDASSAGGAGGLDGGNAGGTGGLDGGNAGSSGGIDSADDAVAAGNATTSEEEAARCVNGDKLELHLSPDIDACVGDGHVYDFTNATCSPVGTVVSYECSWKGAAAALEALGMPQDAARLRARKEAGAKLVACAGAQDGKVIVLQWWDPLTSGGPTASCELSSAMRISTACFEGAGAAPSSNGGTVEMRVASCLSRG